MFKYGKWIAHKEYEGLELIDVKKRDYIVQDNEKHALELRNFHTLYRLKFTSGNNDRVFLKYSADDIAKIYINGKFIDIGPAPAYHFSFNYQVFEITEFLNDENNILCAHLYYQGEINRVSPSGDLRTGFIAEIYDENNSLITCTDKNTKCIKCNAYETDVDNLIGYRTQYIEYFNGNKFDYNWKEYSFDDSKWNEGFVKENNDHMLVLQESKPLQVYDVFSIKAEVIDQNTTLYDLGCEYAGVPHFKIEGKKGDVIEVRCGEELDENNRVRYEMRCNCKYLETHTVSGDIDEKTQFFDYMAFRYFEIIVPKTTVVSDVKMVARNYPFDRNSTSFSSNNKMLDKIIDICKEGVRCGTQEGYLDCPSREKGLYLGDMTITARSHFYLTGDLSILKRALRGFAQSTYYYKGINTTCLNHFTHPLVDYSFQFPLNLLFYYKHSGDKEFLKEMVPYCETMFEFYEAFEKEGLLYDIVKEGHLVDWPRTPYDFTDGYDYNLERGKTTGTHNLANAFHIGGHKNMNEIYDILELEYENRVPYLTKAYIDAFYDEDKKLFKDTIQSNHTSLHANVIPLYYGIVPELAKESVLQLIKEKRLHCGVYISFFLLKGLCQINEHQLAYELITSDDLFSWSTMVKQGASTCFEVWGKELKWNTSLCHPWASAPIIILIEDLLGIRPKSAGWQKGYTKNSKLPADISVKANFHVNGFKIDFESF